MTHSHLPSPHHKPGHTHAPSALHHTSTTRDAIANEYMRKQVELLKKMKKQGVSRDIIQAHIEATRKMHRLFGGKNRSSKQK